MALGFAIAFALCGCAALIVYGLGVFSHDPSRARVFKAVGWALIGLDLAFLIAALVA